MKKGGSLLARGGSSQSEPLVQKQTFLLHLSLTESTNFEFENN